MTNCRVYMKGKHMHCLVISFINYLQMFPSMHSVSDYVYTHVFKNSSTLDLDLRLHCMCTKECHFNKIVVTVIADH